MLVLTRKVGEEIEIGGILTVRIVAARNGRARIGIQAPREIAIRRSELPSSDPQDAPGATADDEVHSPCCRRHTASAILDIG